jgi:sugar phosphate isomerase/epimerase
MRLGVFARTFAGADPATVLAAARAAGFDAVQYNLACSGLASMPATVPPEALAAIRDAVRATGLALAGLSGTYNMIHPDPAVRAAGLARLETVAAAAAAIGAPLVSLCTGTRDPDDQWRAHPDNATPAAWRDLLAEMEKAATIAERHGLRLGIEPERANVVDSPATARALLDAVPSLSLAIVLDPANLFETAPAAERRDLVSRAVDLLGDRIAMAHAKDRDAAGEVVAAGAGGIDFVHFIAALRAAGFDGDLVAHGMTAAEAPGVAAFLRDAARR